MDSIDNQRALEFGDRGQEGKQELACRRGCVERFRERNEADPETVKLLKRGMQMSDRPGETIEAYHDYGVKLSQSGIPHQTIQRRPAVFRSRDAFVGVELVLGASALRVLHQRQCLRRDILALPDRGATGVEGDHSALSGIPSSGSSGQSQVMIFLQI